MAALTSVIRGGLVADAEKEVFGLLVLDVGPALCLVAGLQEKGGMFLTGPVGKLPLSILSTPHQQTNCSFC